MPVYAYTSNGVIVPRYSIQQHGCTGLQALMLMLSAMVCRRTESFQGDITVPQGKPFLLPCESCNQG